MHVGASEDENWDEWEEDDTAEENYIDAEDEDKRKMRRREYEITSFLCCLY